VNSSSLKQSGFSQPLALKSITFSSLPFNGGCVFAIVDTSPTGKESTDILYIGRSKKPTRRIFGGYLSGYGGKNTKRISSNLLNEGYIEKTAISWMSSDKPKAMQSELLEKFVQEHGQVPLWNASKKKQAKIKKAAKKPKPTAQTAKKAEKPAAAKIATRVKPTPAKPTTPTKVTTPPKQSEPTAQQSAASSAHPSSELNHKTA
jgi:hypothetical protein